MVCKEVKTCLQVVQLFVVGVASMPVGRACLGATGTATPAREPNTTFRNAGSSLRPSKRYRVFTY
jgi:hypothetical protein